MPSLSVPLVARAAKAVRRERLEVRSESESWRMSTQQASAWFTARHHDALAQAWTPAYAALRLQGVLLPVLADQRYPAASHPSSTDLLAKRERSFPQPRVGFSANPPIEEVSPAAFCSLRRKASFRSSRGRGSPNAAIWRSCPPRAWIHESIHPSVR